MLTDFQNFFTVRLSKKFVTKTYLNILPYPKRVATLPCEISMFKKSQFLRVSEANRYARLSHSNTALK